MTLAIDDWIFDIDPARTKEHSSFALENHCTCGYCDNFYRTVPTVYPGLKPFLGRFFNMLEGPSEMFPFEPTLCLLGYKVYGKILRYGLEPIMVDGIPILPTQREDEIFMLEVGEMTLPWILDEDMDEVISPANEPEYLENMYRIMIKRGYFRDLLPS